MGITLLPKVTSTQFPAASIRAALRGALIDAVKSEASIKGTSLPSAPDEIAKCSVEIDSLVVVSLLISAEPYVGFELPEGVVRTGGYKSIESGLDHLLPSIEGVWKKKTGIST